MSNICNMSNTTLSSGGKGNILGGDSRPKNTKKMLYKHMFGKALFLSYGQIKIQSIFLF